MKKRFLSVVLCLCMVVGMLPAITTTAQAYTTGDNYPYKSAKCGTYTNDTIDEWNFYYRECTSFVAWCLNNRNGISFTNWYRGVQWGNAGDWGAVARSLGITVDTTPAVGAVAWFAANSYGAAWTGHVAWVSAVNGDNVTIEEYRMPSASNGWADFTYNTRTINKSMVSGYIHIKDIAPSQPDNRATPQNLGSDFYAYISYPNGNLNLENRNRNVQVAAKKTSDPRQIWHFVWDSGRNAYSIINMYDGLYLDSCYGTAGTNVQVLEDTEEYIPAKRWQICGSAGQYYLTAIYRNDHQYVLDVPNAGTTSGTNVQMWDRNGTSAQTFQINKISNIGSIIGYNVGTGFYAQISYNGTYLKTTGTVTESGMNVVTTKTSNTSDPKQIWYFERQSNGSYKIVNQYNGWCLDARGGVAGNKVSVWTWWDDHGDVPERWYIFYSSGDSSYRLVSAMNYPWTGAYNLYSIDIPAGYTTEGTAVEIYQQNTNAWQYFNITKVNYTPTPVVTPSYIITTKTSPSEGGTVSGDGSYGVGKSATVKATANSGYTFKGWTENGSTVSTSASYTFTVNASRTLTAVFEKVGLSAPTVTTWPTAAAVNYGQTLASSALSGGKASVSGTFKWNDSSVMPKTGQSYDVTFTPSDITKYSTVSGKVSVTVNKSTPALSVSASQSGTSVVVNASASNPYNAALTDVPTPTVAYRIGNGTAQRVTGSSFTIPEGTTSGTVITITASTAENGNYQATEKSTTLTVSSAANGTSYHVLTTSGSDLGGSVNIQPASATQGETVTVTATPRSGYRLGGVTATGASGAAIHLTNLGGGRYTFTMPNGNVTLDAVFEATQDDWVNPFSDIAEGAWYYDAVKFVSQNGLMNGSNGAFDHSGKLSRAMIAQILYNKEGRPEVSSGQVFNDVASSAWYADAISWAAVNKLVLGDEKGSFSPNNPITREQLALILWRYEGSPTSSSGALNFTDAGRISSYAREAMSWAVANGIISGKGGGVLDPQGPATRAQVAQMLKNYLST